MFRTWRWARFALQRRQQVQAPAQAVMRWLTDADRRRVEAAARLGAYEHVERVDVEELPNRGLRFTAVITLPGNRRLHQEAHDVAILGDRLERRVSAALLEPGRPAFRCVLRELVQVE